MNNKTRESSRSVSKYQQKEGGRGRDRDKYKGPTTNMLLSKVKINEKQSVPGIKKDLEMGLGL